MPEIGRCHLPYLEIRGSGTIAWRTAALATDYLLNMRVAADTNPRFRIRADGWLEWGPGNAPPDVVLYRVSGVSLGTYDRFRSSYQLEPAYGQAAGRTAIVTQVNADTSPRFSMDNQAIFTWGSGAAAVDCQLSRNAANELRTPDQLTVQGGVSTLVKAGAIGDGDFATAVDGLLGIDSTNNRGYARYGGAWHWWALT